MLLPFSEVAIVGQPVFNAGVVDDEVVIKGAGECAAMGAAGEDAFNHTAVGRIGIEEEGGISNRRSEGDVPSNRGSDIGRDSNREAIGGA